MPPSLNKLKGILSTALEHTAPLWPAIATVDDWVHRTAEILNNEAQQSAHAVQRSYQGLLGAITRWQARAGDLAAGVAHFLNVTRSDWPGLFHCYERADLPRTNNDLEQCFGSWRYHQRRSTGRKTAPASSVLRGAVQFSGFNRNSPACGDGSRFSSGFAPAVAAHALSTRTASAETASAAALSS